MNVVSRMIADHQNREIELDKGTDSDVEDIDEFEDDIDTPDNSTNKVLIILVFTLLLAVISLAVFQYIKPLDLAEKKEIPRVPKLSLVPPNKSLKAAGVDQLIASHVPEKEPTPPSKPEAAEQAPQTLSKVEKSKPSKKEKIQTSDIPNKKEKTTVTPTSTPSKTENIIAAKDPKKIEEPIVATTPRKEEKSIVTKETNKKEVKAEKTLSLVSTKTAALKEMTPPKIIIQKENTAPPAKKKKVAEKPKTVTPIVVKKPERDVTHVEKVPRKPTNQQLAEKSYSNAMKLIKKKQWAKARDKLIHSLKLNPQHFKAREALVGTYIKDSRNAEVISTLEDGVLHNPTYFKFRQMLARFYLEDGRGEKALDLLNNARDHQKKSAKYFSLVAAIQQSLNQFDAAYNSYQSALKLKPDEAVWWLGMGLASESQGKYQEAEQAYLQASRLGNLTQDIQTYIQRRLNTVRLHTVTKE